LKKVELKLVKHTMFSNRMQKNLLLVFHALFLQFILQNRKEQCRMQHQLDFGKWF